MRLTFWLLVYALLLFSVSIKVQYSDGIQINLVGWWDYFFRNGGRNNNQTMNIDD